MGTVAAPAGGLVGNSNYFLINDTKGGEPITDLSVIIQITEDIVVPLGMSIQLNGYCRTTDNCDWQQYVFTFVPGTNPQLRWMIDNWPTDGYRQTLNIPATSDLINQGGFIVNVSDGPSRLPAGYTLTIALTNDASGNIIGLTCQAIDNHNNASSNQPNPIVLEGLPVSNTTSNQTIGPKALAPIIAFQLNIVGMDNGNVTLLESGAGTITYVSTTPMTVMSGQPAKTSSQGVFTEEESNTTYGTLGEGPSTQFTQTFKCPAPQFKPGAGLAASQQFGANNQTDVFVVEPNGRLHLYSIASGGAWKGPLLIGPSGVAPSGAPLAVSEKFGAGGQTDVFVIGNNGQLQVFTAKGTNSWQGPHGIGPLNFALPGSSVVASQQFGVDNQTDVFVVDKSGKLHVFWSKGEGKWHGPDGIGPSGFAPAGAGLAVSQQFGATNQTDVFVVDNSGQLNVFWVQGEGGWGGPSPIGPAGFAPPGARLAASQQFGADNQTNVYVVNDAGQLTAFWVENAGSWSAPVPIGTSGFAPPGASLSVSQQFGAENQTDVFVIDNNGFLNVFFIENASSWGGPVQLSPAGYAPPGSASAASQQFGGDQTDVFLINNAGQPNVYWVVAANPWGGPTPLSSPQ